MRVLVVTTWYPTASSPGTGVFVARDVAALASRYDVRVLHLCAPGLLGDGEAGGPGDAVDPGDGVQVTRVAMDPRRPDHVLRARRTVHELARGADVLHTMAVSALLPMAMGRPRHPGRPREPGGPPESGAPGVPWVHTEHWSGLLAPETLSPALRAARPVVLRLLRRPDVVAVVSEHLAAGVRAVREGPVVVVPNIVAAPAVLCPRREPAVALTSGRRLELVAVGGLIERKDPLRAVEATAELRRRGVDARLTWVGGGPLREVTSRLAEHLAVPLTLTGPVAPDSVAAYVAGADLFLLPTHAETFCVAAAEALGAGRPVVVGDSGGPSDFVGPPSGALVTPRAPAPAWADAVERVWTACSGLSAEDIAAPVRDAYSPEAFADRVAALYRDLRVPAEEDQSGGPLVDVVIATHSARRRTDRAVRSVLSGSGDVDVRVTVVCHDLPAEEVAASLSPATRDDPRVRLIEHRDGVRSPAGPFTAGLAAATAPWVSILGSDDRLSPGALAHWLGVARSSGAEVVLAEIELDGGRVATPPTRVRPGRSPRRADHLDLVRDRLSYRSAPLGLLSRQAVSRTGARLLAGAQTGEDVPFVTRLYAGAGVARAEGTPYLVGVDAGDRATSVPRPVADELVAVTALLDDPWFAALPVRQRRAVATKLLRIHVFGTVTNRPDPDWWTTHERMALAAITDRLLTEVPGAADPLSRADHDLLAAIRAPETPASRLVELARARRRHGSPRTLLPHSWRHVLHPEAPLRFMVASLAARL